MEENTHNALPAYFKGAQFGVKNTPETRETAAQFFQYFYKEKKTPETAKAFLMMLLRMVADLSGKLSAVNPEEVNRLKTENEKLNNENSDYKRLEEFKIARIKELEEEIEKLKSGAPAAPSEIITDPTSFALLPDKLQNQINDLTEQKKLLQLEINQFLMHDVRLFFLSEYKKTDADTIAEMILNMKAAYDNTITGIMHVPLRLLEDKEYEALLKWDAEVFMPALEAMLPEEWKQKYGIVDIKTETTARHKFYLFWQFVLFDPAEKMEALLPGLTDEQKESLQNMRFPLPFSLENVCRDIQLKKTAPNDTTQPVQEQTTAAEPANEGATVIKLNPTATVTDLSAETSAGTDGPE